MMVFYLSGSLPLFEFVSISYCVVSLIWQRNSLSLLEISTAVTKLDINKNYSKCALLGLKTKLWS